MARLLKLERDADETQRRAQEFGFLGSLLSPTVGGMIADDAKDDARNAAQDYSDEVDRQARKEAKRRLKEQQRLNARPASETELAKPGDPGYDAAHGPNFTDPETGRFEMSGAWTRRAPSVTPSGLVDSTLGREAGTATAITHGLIDDAVSSGDRADEPLPEQPAPQGSRPTSLIRPYDPAQITAPRELPRQPTRAVRTDQPEAAPTGRQNVEPISFGTDGLPIVLGADGLPRGGKPRQSSVTSTTAPEGQTVQTSSTAPVIQQGDLSDRYPRQDRLSDKEWQATCGPVAGTAVMASLGLPADYDDMKERARQAGWTYDRGMAGPQSFAQMMASKGVQMEQGAIDPDRIKAELAQGRVVVLNSPGSGGHYFVVQGVDAQGRLDLGNTATALKASGGQRYWTLDEMRQRLGSMGQVSSALYVKGGPQNGAAQPAAAPTNGTISLGANGLPQGTSGAPQLGADGLPVAAAPAAPATTPAAPAAPAVAPGGGLKDWAVAESKRLGIDPDVTIAVGNTEGGWDDPVRQNAQGAPAYGPFQAYIGGKDNPGLGDELLERGIDPRDPKNAQKVITYILEHVKRNGWGAMQGAAKNGIDKWAGIPRQGTR